MAWLLVGVAGFLGGLAGILVPQSRLRGVTSLGLGCVGLGYLFLALSWMPRSRVSAISLLVVFAAGLFAAGLTLSAVTMVRQWRRRARALFDSSTI